MNTDALAYSTDIPAHVPPELVVQFSHLVSPAMFPTDGSNPYDALQQLHQGPRIYYTPAFGRMLAGNWVLTRNEDIRAVLTNPELFSSRGIAGFSHLLGESWDMIPLEVDPPQHTRYRQFLGPLFAPGRVHTMTGRIEAICAELVDEMAAQGECEFVRDFSRRFPVRVFMDLMGLPLADYTSIMDWEEKILHDPNIAVRAAGARAIRPYLEQLLRARSAQPQNDLLSLIAGTDVGGQRLSATEQLSLSLFLFVAGLDTVASALGYIYRYLALHPAQQQWLREDLRRLPDAIEELLRAHAVVVTSRFATRDTEVAGVFIKAGDAVSVPLALANFDSSAIPAAAEIQLDRNPNRHLTFSSGPHHCLGAHLARKEIQVAIAQWLVKIPDFRVKPHTIPRARGGAVFGVDELQLVWDAQG